MSKLTNEEEKFLNSARVISKYFGIIFWVMIISSFVFVVACFYKIYLNQGNLSYQAAEFEVAVLWSLAVSIGLGSKSKDRKFLKIIQKLNRR